MPDRYDRLLLSTLARIGGGVTSRELAYHTGLPPQDVHERMHALCADGEADVYAWATPDEQARELADATARITTRVSPFPTPHTVESEFRDGDRPVHSDVYARTRKGGSRGPRA